MSMKTILVPMEKHDGMQSVLETALLLARRYDSYIEGFSLAWTPVDFAVGDIVVAFPVEQYKRGWKLRRSGHDRRLNPLCRKAACLAQLREQHPYHSAG